MDLTLAAGAREFFSFIARETPDWSLAAVEAPIGDVTRALVARLAPAGWETDVGSKRIPPARKPCFVLQLRGHPWCLVLRTLAWVDPDAMEAVREDAQALSEELRTDALAFTGEHASARIHYALFRGGAALEEAEWEGEELCRFRSELRGRPKGPLGPQVVVDLLFRERRLYLPTFSLDSDGGQMWLALKRLPVSAVERADFLALRR
ncbi:MAG TPA: hypothetical protein VK447_10180 [Myxococcaceae bacterium]|nr:hypothetical protein [Myxococcaceae bacterium]